jgi:hypothetical protein
VALGGDEDAHRQVPHFGTCQARLRCNRLWQRTFLVA